MPNPRVRPLGVVVLEIHAGEMVEVACTHHDEPVEALVLQRLDESLRVGVEVGRAVGQADGRHAGFPQRPIERLPELRVAVTREDPAPALTGQALEA